eukprot:CCRYP_002378-RB/>CCRYP_002378-RB protein AED:0.04 eAED:0.04 QI:1304/1/1/1/1/0.9/10/693/1105
MECDVREFIPFEEGGLLGKPEDPTSGMTDKELALSLGFTWPSLKESDHYFCGVTLENANSLCAIPCSDGTAVACDHGQLCFYGTECDARVRPDYYITDSPVPPPSPAPISRDDRINFSFCGVDWAEANTCSTKWCGKDESCPEGKSCFADTECNVLDQPPMKPTKTPTWSPVTYDDEVNNFFCGETYLDACAKCSYETYCRTGKHSECGPNSFCWPGVTCNVKDMEPEITPRPTIDSAEPTKSPLPYDDPTNFRFCGFNWTDASSSCTNGRMPRWCPSGSENECPQGQQCFADTTCHISTVVFPPSLQPTGSPTNYTSPAPTLPAAAYDDPIFTSFCGPTYLEASAACSIDTYCPSGVHADCPENQYCWSGTTCNVHDFWPPPTPRPSNPPSLRYFPSLSPSGVPSTEPTSMPTSSPLGESDPRNFMYCGTSWGDAAARCHIKCPDEKCPGDMTCFAQTGCPAIPNDSPAPTVPDPTSGPTFLLTEINSSYVDVDQTSSENSSLVNRGSSSPTESVTDSVSTFVSPSPSVESSTTLTSPMSANPTLAPERNSIMSNSTALTVTNPSQPIASEVIWSPASPSSKPATSYEILDLPDVSLSATPKPPSSNVELVLNALRNVSQSLENDIFVVETRGGSVLKSNLYTYHGFESSILYYSTSGVNADFFYMGEVDGIEPGIVNLALFLSKAVTDTIAYESCDPNKLACGMWALDSTFQNNIRFQCSASSRNAGLECLDGSVGCACILGALDSHIGSKSSIGTSSYSQVNFCLLDPYQSICSRYIGKGEELRWLVPMSYWVSFVQRYSSSQPGFPETYISGLKTFVDGGMRDTAFVEFVAEISIFPSAGKAPKEKFLANYFKIMELLRNNIVEQSTPDPLDTLTTTSVPSKRLGTTPALLNTLTRSPSPSPTKSPLNVRRTVMPSHKVDNQSLVNYCPVLCVVPIKTSECPSPGRKLKHCFGKSKVDVDELCLATYGECGTSSISVNNCGKAYNVFKRIDCSILVDFEESTPEEASEISSPAPDLLPPTSSPSTPSVSSLSPTRTAYWGFGSSPWTSTTSPTTEQYSSFGGKVWWENINSSRQSTQSWRAIAAIIILCQVTATLLILDKI